MKEEAWHRLADNFNEQSSCGITRSADQCPVERNEDYYQQKNRQRQGISLFTIEIIYNLFTSDLFTIEICL